jgi:hypothetical protein
VNISKYGKAACLLVVPENRPGISGLAPIGLAFIGISTRTYVVRAEEG